MLKHNTIKGNLDQRTLLTLVSPWHSTKKPY